MKQVVELAKNDRWHTTTLPAPRQELMPGVRWGRVAELYTPAYWAAQAWMCVIEQRSLKYTLGTTLGEEVTACILGGHGMPAEVGLAAYDRLRTRGLIAPGIQRELIESALKEPLNVCGRVVKYRFASQKARYLSIALGRLHSAKDLECRSAIQLRRWLMDLPGVGPKTASWIVRNWLHSDDVAILDTHIVRAGQLMGVFGYDVALPRDYMLLEQRFISFAQAVGVKTSVLDALMWLHMRDSPPSVRACSADERDACANEATGAD